MKYIFIFSLILFAFLGYQSLRIYRLSRISLALVKHTHPFSYTPARPNSNALFIGDSLAVGVGARSEDKTIAGYFSHDHPQAKIINLAVSGSKINDGLLVMQSLVSTEPEIHFNVIIIQLGANDIVQMSPLTNTKQLLEALLLLARAHADRVIFLTAGDVGHAPIFLPPVSWFYSYRSRQFFRAFEEVAVAARVTYVDLYYAGSRDPFSKNTTFYYATDQFHVTGDAYKFWYKRIALTGI